MWRWGNDLSLEIVNMFVFITTQLHYILQKCLKIHCLSFYSNYPEKRKVTDADGIEQGIMGNISLLQNCTLSSQPISSLDWSPDKQGLAICTSFDQCLRVIITTKLNTYWLNNAKKVHVNMPIPKQKVDILTLYT